MGEQINWLFRRCDNQCAADVEKAKMSYWGDKRNARTQTRAVLLLGSVFLCALMLSACGAQSKIAGKWAQDSSSDNYSGAYIEFFSDGTWTGRIQGLPRDDHKGNYTLYDNHLKLFADSAEDSFDGSYTVFFSKSLFQGSVIQLSNLTITDGAGQSMIYVNQQPFPIPVMIIVVIVCLVVLVLGSSILVRRHIRRNGDFHPKWARGSRATIIAFGIAFILCTVSLIASFDQLILNALLDGSTLLFIVIGAIFMAIAVFVLGLYSTLFLAKRLGEQNQGREETNAEVASKPEYKLAPGRGTKKAVIIYCACWVVLVLIGAGVILARNLPAYTAESNQPATIEIFIKDGAKQSDVESLQRKLETNPLVEKVNYVSKEQALEQFKAQMKQSPDVINNEPSVGFVRP